MQAYYDRMIVMGIKLSGLLATGLELDPSFFDGCFSNSLSQLRITRYSSQVGQGQRYGWMQRTSRWGGVGWGGAPIIL